MPQRRWLAFYAEHFDTVEVNSSFYRLPKRPAVEGWASATPDGFLFAVKVSRYVTHIKRLSDVGQSLPRLLEPLAPLIESQKLGPLLWQLPPNFARDEKRLAAALAVFPRNLRHAIEFRHRSWFDDQILALLREHGVALVVADRPELHDLSTEPTADLAYVRFHHGSRGRRGNYSGSELAEWAARVHEWSTRCDVFAYFNNDWEGFAPANAAALRDVVGDG